MKIELIKGSGRSYCRGRSCKELPEYINNGRIKKDTTCISIGMRSAGGWNTSYYCRDCIDQLYLEMKKALNPALWIFK